MKPVLVVIAGANGAGKTYLTEKLLAHKWLEGLFYINPDNIAQKKYGDWNSPEALKKAADEAKRLREDLLAKKKGIAFETVLSTQEKVSFIRRAKKAGYFVRFFYIGTADPQINASRIMGRYMAGGHAVPIPKILERAKRSLARCIEVAPIVDRFYVYDNSVDDRLPELLFRGTDSEIKVYAEIPSWALRIYKRVADRFTQ